MAKSDAFYMQEAINIAREHETPYGAVIVDLSSGTYLKAANTTSEKDKTAHAEMNALRELIKFDYSAKDNLCIYSTGEPCPMCMGAILWSGIRKVKYAVSIEQIAEFHAQIMIGAQEVNNKWHKECHIQGGVLVEESLQLFKDFG